MRSARHKASCLSRAAYSSVFLSPVASSAKGHAPVRTSPAEAIQAGRDGAVALASLQRASSPAPLDLVPKLSHNPAWGCSMAHTVNVHEAKTHLSRLLELVRKGEEVVIAKAGKPVAKLTAIREAQGRVLGAARGQAIVADDFDDPLPPDVLEAFYR